MMLLLLFSQRVNQWLYITIELFGGVVVSYPLQLCLLFLCFVLRFILVNYEQITDDLPVITLRLEQSFRFEYDLA